MRNTIIIYAFLSCMGLLLSCEDDDKVEAVLPESELTVNPEEIVFQQAGGESGLTITTNRGWCLEKGEGTWFKIDGDEVGAGGEHAVKLVATENPGTEKRVSKVNVMAGTKKQELNVTQFGSDPDMVIPEKEITLDFDEGDRAVVVHSNTKVELSTLAEWITISENYALNSTQFMMHFKNNSGEERRGSLTVKAGTKEETITVIQKAWVANIHLSTEVLLVGSQRRNGSVILNASGDWTLEFEGGQQPDWIMDVPLAGSRGTSELLFTFKPNDTEVVHECNAIIRCGDKQITLKVIQNKSTLRERDSLALVALYNEAISHGTDKWDFSLPMTQWTPAVVVSEQRVIRLQFTNWKFDRISKELGNLTALTTLTFSLCNFNDVNLPAEMGQLVKLADFSCVGDKCLKLPPEVSRCESLKEVFLSGIFQSVGGNTELKGTEIPEELCALASLERLTCQTTDIKELPESIANSNINYLFVETCKLTQIPAFLGKMKKLRYLTIRNCDIKGTIPVELWDAPELKSCVLSKNNIIDEFPAAALKLPKLYELILGANRLKGDLPKELVDSKITILDVSQNMLGGPDKMLDQSILEDARFKDDRAWAGKTNICMQKDGYGWNNCK